MYRDARRGHTSTIAAGAGAACAGEEWAEAGGEFDGAWSLGDARRLTGWKCEWNGSADGRSSAAAAAGDLWRVSNRECCAEEVRGEGERKRADDGV